MPLDATSLHIQHPRGPPEATAPPTSRSGPKIEKRPTDTLSSGGTGGVPRAAPERLCATEIPRTALFRPVVTKGITRTRVYIYILRQFLPISGLGATPLPAHQFARGSACASAARVPTPAAWSRHRSQGRPGPRSPGRRGKKVPPPPSLRFA